jgi:hypothetical protein
MTATSRRTASPWPIDPENVPRHSNCAYFVVSVGVATRVDETIEIARAPDEVAGYMFDWRNDPEWIGGISEAELLTGEPFGIGSRVKRIASFLGRRIEYVLEVEEYDARSRVAMRSVEGPFPMTVEYDVAAAGAGTTARVRVGGDASGFYRVAGPLLNRAAARSTAGDLRRLRNTLEQ